MNNLLLVVYCFALKINIFYAYLILIKNFNVFHFGLPNFAVVSLTTRDNEEVYNSMWFFDWSF